MDSNQSQEVGFNSASRSETTTSTTAIRQALDLLDTTTASQKRKLEDFTGIVPQEYALPLQHAMIYTGTETQRELRYESNRLTRIKQQMEVRSDDRAAVLKRIKELYADVEKTDREFDVLAAYADEQKAKIGKLLMKVEAEGGMTMRDAGVEAATEAKHDEMTEEESEPWRMRFD